MKHFLSGEEINTQQLDDLLMLASECKSHPQKYKNVLQNKHILLSFDKPSLRTRLTFTAGIQQLGGHVLESHLETRKQEEPQDFIRVVQSYADALVIRTFLESTLETMMTYSDIPIINALSDNFHPCQILADLLTLKEKFGNLSGLKLAYIGDGNNILHSLLLMAPKVGITVNYCCPPDHEPQSEIVKIAKELVPGDVIQVFSAPQSAVEHCHAVYTDVWTSMGFSPANEKDFENFQVNEELMDHAQKEAVFMHCLPMERGKEVSNTLPDKNCSVIFQQAENRLHAQKALLIQLFS